MKKILITAAVFSLVGISCKKNYTCTCVTTDEDSGISPARISHYPNASTTYSAKMTRKQAEAACDHEEQAIHTSYNNWATQNGTSRDPNFTTYTDCSIKK